jgi:hypothetical protein
VLGLSSRERVSETIDGSAPAEDPREVAQEAAEEPTGPEEPASEVAASPETAVPETTSEAVADVPEGEGAPSEESS